MEDKKKIILVTRIDSHIHDKLKTLAKREERTVASIVRQALKEFLQRRGGWKLD